MDTPRTPDIVIPAPTLAYLKMGSDIAPIPDEVIRNDEGDARFYIYGFEKLDVLDSATERALEAADEEMVSVRLRTLKNIFNGMRTAIDEISSEQTD